MALKLNERYPGRFNNPSASYPQGSFKNRTTPAAKDGSYLEQDWANDCLGFLSSILSSAGVEANGNVDAVGASQYFDALQVLIGSHVTTITATSALTKSQAGLVIASATSGPVTITLPAGSSATGIVEFIIRRFDTTGNALTIAASGADKIMLDTTATPAGLASTELLFSGDFLRLRSDGAGKWWCVGQADLPGSMDSGYVAYSVAGVYTYSTPAVLRSGRRTPMITVVGGGGGSARSSSGPSGAGAGGGAAKKRVSLSGVTSTSITVGQGGAGRATSAGVGVSGGTSAFGTSHNATGGEGGKDTTSRSAGGAGVGGDTNYSGSSGSGGFSSGDSGRAGDAIYGGGQAGASAGTTSGLAGGAPGAGGSGSAVNVDGVKGADGQVEIEW